MDRDDRPVPKPARVELATAFDVLENTFSRRPKGSPPPAANVDTLGRVPDSSWFTNRLGAREMTREELVRGANRGPGPDVDGPLEVVGAKTGGITPGFTIRDSRGDVYFVKFDPAAHPALSTAADVIGSRFFHALGYHVPENHVAFIRREQLRIAEGVRVRERGRRRLFTGEDLDRSLAGAARLPDGRVRIVASRALPGEPIGPFEYHGTRPDDPNDVFPHEHRRELRGLRVFAAWLNHDDSRSVNTLDTWLPAGDGLGRVRHHLIDFSSILGAGSSPAREIAPQNPRAGNEYVLEKGPGLRALFSLGFLDRPWRKVRFPRYPGVGNIEADFFRPEAWRPEYPNPAFERMRPADAFWAARILLGVTDEAIRDVVATGKLGSAESEAYLASVLVRRRDKVLRWCFEMLNPLDDFAIAEGRLRFRNLGEEAGLGPADGYEIAWSRFDNATGAREALGPPAVVGATDAAVPQVASEFLVARIRTRARAQGNWAKAVDVFLRGPEGARVVVGVEREE